MQLISVLVLIVIESSSCQRSAQQEGRQAFDILGSLNSLRSNILSILGTPFNNNQPRPPPRPSRPATFSGQPQSNFIPPPPPQSSRPLPPRQPPPPLPPLRPFTQGVFNSGSSSSFSASQPQQPSSSFNNEFPSSFSEFSMPTISENPIIDLTNNFDSNLVNNNFNNLQSENLLFPSVDISNNIASEPEGSVGSSLPAPVPVDVGPATFIDSDRVNAGLAQLSGDSESEIDENLLNHIPHDLWREDVDGIKHQKKIRVTRKRRRSVSKKTPETATLPDPQLLVQ